MGLSFQISEDSKFQWIQIWALPLVVLVFSHLTFLAIELPKLNAAFVQMCFRSHITTLGNRYPCSCWRSREVQGRLLANRRSRS